MSSIGLGASLSALERFDFFIIPRLGCGGKAEGYAYIPKGKDCRGSGEPPAVFPLPGAGRTVCERNVDKGGAYSAVAIRLWKRRRSVATSARLAEPWGLSAPASFPVRIPASTAQVMAS